MELLTVVIQCWLWKKWSEEVGGGAKSVVYLFWYACFRLSAGSPALLKYHSFPLICYLRQNHCVSNIMFASLKSSFSSSFSSPVHLCLLYYISITSISVPLFMDLFLTAASSSPQTHVPPPLFCSLIPSPPLFSLHSFDPLSLFNNQCISPMIYHYYYCYVALSFFQCHYIYLSVFPLLCC